MSDKLLVYRLGQPPIELERSQVWLFDRSRYLQGQACPHKRWLGYHWQGRGVETARRSEDLVLGSAVHAGLEEMLGYYCKPAMEEVALSKGDIEACAEIARDEMLEAGQQGLMIQDSESYGDTSPDLAQLLIEEQANLAYALVWAFGKRRLASLLERYEVVAVEPEILWLVGWMPYPVATEGVDGRLAGSGKAIVMMSRPDAVLRSRADGKLRTVSWKTAQRFQLSTAEELEIHSQTMTEGMAVEAMWGEPSIGTFFSYFIKGPKAWDASIGMKRYQSGLIRPYMSYGGIGELGPANFKVVGEWPNPDEPGKNRKITKGWYRTDIWQQMEMAEWLEMLAGGEVQPEAGEGRDWLGEATVEPLEQPFAREYAERWRQQAIQDEQDWMKVAGGERIASLNEGECFNKWNKKCTYYDICWHGDTVEQQLASGRKVMRAGNHPAEFGGGDE